MDKKSGMTPRPKAFLWVMALLTLPNLVIAQELIFPDGRRTFFPATRPKVNQGESCFPHDSCQVRGNSRDTLPMDRRNCHCDNACAEYGDCCRDARSYNPDSARKSVDTWDCVMLRKYQGIFLKVACPPSWTDVSIRELCELNTDDDRDPFQRLPMTSRNTQLTYKNYFCALCNKDIASPIFWLPHLECDDRVKSEFDSNNSTNFWDHITYNRTLESWGVPGTNDSFIACAIDPDMPQMVEDMVRRCIPFTNRCAGNWTNYDVRHRCASYTAYVYDGDIVYRNWDCATCNYVKSVGCSRVDVRRTIQTFNPNIFTVLFDVNAQNGQRVGEIKRCDDNEVYDPFVRRCRSIICGQPNEIYRQGRCITADQVSTPPTESSSNSSSNDVNNLTFVSSNEVTVTEKMTQPTSTDADVVIFPIDENTSHETSMPTSNNTEVVNGTMGLNVTTDAGMLLDETSYESETTYYTEDEDGETALTVNATQQYDSTTIKPDISTITSLKTSTVTRENKHDKATYKVITEETSKPTSTISTETTKPDASVTSGKSTELPPTTKPSETTSKILDCEQFELNTDEFELLENGSAYLEVYSRVLMPHEYQNKDAKLFVCVQSVLGTEYSNYIRKFSSYLAIVALIGLGISLICLVLHLAAFSLVSDLRNLSGNNLASLCVALIFAYTMFILAQFNSTPSTFCTMIGIVMCYSFLSSFFWMNTMAFDVWRALRQATTELRISSGQQWRKFFVYCAYSWLSPLLIVITAVVIENIPSIPEDLRPAFGQRLCWFNHRRALLLFFVVPIITIIIINILLFSLSAYMIVSTTQSSAKFHNHKTQRTFRLYLRLALLMGLTWVVGIVAAAADVDPLWYVFVAFNTLQGLFIFFAFTCNKKVLQSIASRFTRHARLSRKSSTFVDSCSGARLTKKNGLEARDSADSHSSQTSRSSLTQSTTVRSSSSVDTLY